MTTLAAILQCAPARRHWETKDFRHRRKPKQATLLARISAETPPKRIGRKLLWGATATIVSVAVGYGSYRWLVVRSISPVAVTNQLISVARSSPYALPIYGASASLLTLAFFPDILIIVASGMLFGTAMGVVMSLCSQVVAIALAYFIGKQIGAKTGWGTSLRRRIESYAEPLKERTFETALLMRLAHLPLEAVSYVSGFLHVEWKPYLAGTIIGILPSTVFLAMVGSSLAGSVLTGAPLFSPFVLAANGIVFASGIGIAAYLRRKHG